MPRSAGCPVLPTTPGSPPVSALHLQSHLDETKPIGIIPNTLLNGGYVKTTNGLIEARLIGYRLTAPTVSLVFTKAACSMGVREHIITSVNHENA